MAGEKILVVEDNKLFRFSLSETLKEEGYSVIEAGDGNAAIEIFKEEEPDLIILDLKIPKIPGMEVLKRIKEITDDIPIIIITGHGDISSAVSAMKLGAFDYLTKPLNMEDLKLAVKKALESTSLKREVQLLREKYLKELGLDSIVAESEAMKNILEEVKRIVEADTSATVLLQGESGTGKDMIAKLIHYSSSRASGPFVELNCAAIPKELLESELMGYEPGAFTGAKGRKIGLLEKAKGGTLFLDEIGEIPLEMQAKLLRILETKTFRRLGGLKDITVDVRFIAATNRDLSESVKKGEFREDLYWRLNVISIYIPPLRERKEDIIPLAKFFIDKFNREMRRSIKGLTKEVEELFLIYDWPGNVRELKNVIERAVILGKGDYITPDLLPKEIRDLKSQARSFSSLDQLEKEAIEKALREAGGNVSKAARILGVSRDLLRYRMKKYGIERGTTLAKEN